MKNTSVKVLLLVKFISNKILGLLRRIANVYDYTNFELQINYMMS